jgi:hypothetical protein
MAEAVPPWKFWHPLPFWQVVVIAFVAQIVCIIPLVALNQLAGLAVPEWIASGIAGGVMFAAVRIFAQRRLAAGK